MSDRGYVYVAEPAPLQELVERISGESSIALDTEANSLYNYFERVCLIQLSVGKKHYIVDPQSKIDLGPFLKALAHKELILHGADFDLRLLRSTFGFKPKGEVFDSMLAAQLLGYERVGYAALVEQFVNVNLSKSGQKSNWAKRPLTDEQLDYAVDDTRYLGRVSKALRAELEKLGRSEWHREWCQRTVKSTQVNPERDEDNMWRIKGLGGLDRKELAFVRAIWRWRDQEARKADRPPFKMLGNESLVRLATWAARDPKAKWDEHPSLPKHCQGRRLNQLKAAIHEAQRLPKSKWPHLRRINKFAGNGNSDYKLQTEALRRECAKIAHALKLPPAVLSPKATLAAIARNDARTPREMRACSSIMDWQIELVKDSVSNVLAGFDGQT